MEAEAEIREITVFINVQETEETGIRMRLWTLKSFPQ